MLKKASKKIPVVTVRGDVRVKDRLHHLNRKECYAVLATDAGGQPYTTLIAYALAKDLKGVVFATPKNTSKYRNILKNSRVSVLIDSRFQTGCDYLNTESVTVIGAAHALRKGGKWTASVNLLKKKHPQLRDFFTSPTTAIIHIDVTHYIHVDRFQRISEWQVRTAK